MKCEVLRVETPAPRDIWKELMDDNEQVLIYQTPEWLDSLVRLGGHEDASRLYQFSTGEMAILTMVRRIGRPQSLTTYSSMPHGWGTGGIITRGLLHSGQMEEVFADLHRIGGLRTSIRLGPLTSHYWDKVQAPRWRKVVRGTHILNIQNGYQHFWEEVLSSSTRTKIRKAEKAGITVARDNHEQSLPIFYHLYMKWIEDRARQRRMPLALARLLGKLREPYEKFQSVCSQFGEACQIWIASKDDQPISAAILLIHQAHAFYWRSYSDRRLSGPTRANELLQVLMIEGAINAGCRFYHMGESGGMQSLKNYKEKFGAVEYQYKEYYLENLPWLHFQDNTHDLMKRLENRLVRGSMKLSK
jgi:hypothetical protein